MADQFDNHVKAVMMDLSVKIQNNPDQTQVNNNVLKAKFALYEICFVKSIDLLNKFDPRVVNILQTLHD